MTCAFSVVFSLFTWCKNSGIWFIVVREYTVYDRTTQTHLSRYKHYLLLWQNGTARLYLSGASCDTERTGCEAWICSCNRICSGAGLATNLNEYLGRAGVSVPFHCSTVSTVPWHQKKMGAVEDFSVTLKICIGSLKMSISHPNTKPHSPNPKIEQ